MAFMLYFVGFVVFVAGVAALATAIGISETLVTGAALLLLAMGLCAGILRHRARERHAPV
ncbi:MAG TPA: hypothetical protein VFJ62_07740 [Usitatibacter sp.]|nr:hypothetical protein [Usitatibacter sp.]